ncbi:MAG: S41 family peptidase [Sedimentisphaerales bacterium]|nr:S41 family peptidase [Sedimentisphaerales bacterium]
MTNLLRRTIYTVALAVFFCFVVESYATASASRQREEDFKTVENEPLVTKADVVDSICELIYQGRFDDANALVRKQLRSSESFEDSVGVRTDSQDRGDPILELAGIIRQYNELTKQRQQVREDTYRKQLVEVDSIRLATEANEPNDPNNINDSNNISRALAAIAKACEFAGERQKAALISKPFVQLVFDKAKAQASKYESMGKWLDAYICCYSWLQTIVPDNNEYSERAKQLIDKANIVASFRDSPCQTRQERFKRVTKKMFVRAIDALNHNYVSVIDYRRMAIKAIKRCLLLGEVAGSSLPQVGPNGSSAWLGEEAETLFSSADVNKISAWSAALSVVLDDVENCPTGVTKDKFLAVFDEVLELNAATAQLPRSVLIVHFAEGALSSLGPYTVMIWPSQVSDFEKEISKEFTGIGIEITKPKGLLTVASLLPDTPAYNSGLDAGDIIEKVDGLPTKDMSLTCAVRRITGPADTKVTLTIRRAGQDKTRDIIITRAKIVVKPIRGWKRAEAEAGKWLYMLDEAQNVGYVRVTNFDSRTAPELEKILSQLESKRLRGLILDLRFNPGGLLDSAVNVVDKFIDEGLIVWTQPRRWAIPTYEEAHTKNTHPDYPLVVLINSYSASASEIVAGALADSEHERAVLVGERTHGKGSVQGITSYPGGGAQLRYTMSYYRLPSGQKVESREEAESRGDDNWGVKPDIEVKLTSDELEKMSEIQRENNVLVKADHDKQAVPLKKHSFEETLAADPQLATALLVIKTKLIQSSGLLTEKSCPCEQDQESKHPQAVKSKIIGQSEFTPHVDRPVYNLRVKSKAA